MLKTNTEELTERLVERAEMHITTYGPKHLRMDDLAQDLGVSKKTIYRIVESKDALVRCIIERFVGDVRQRMKALIERKDLPFEEKLNRYFELISQALRRFDSRVFVELERYFPEIYKRIEAIRREVLPEMLTLLMKQGQAEGYVREDLNILVFSEAFLQSVQGMFRSDSMNAHGLQPHEIPTALGELFIRGIRKDPN